MTNRWKKGRFRKVRTEYWDTTYLALNPFMPPVRCPECGEKPNLEREYFPKEFCGAVGINEFKCKSGHLWSRRKTYD